MLAARVATLCALAAAGALAGRCEPVALDLCRNLGYNATVMPNFMGHESQLAADLGLQSFAPLLSHKCSPHVRLFVCSAFAPMCSEQFPGPIPACRGLCERVLDDCVPALEEMGLRGWPSELNCSSFPEPPEMCMQPEDSEPSQQHHLDVEELARNLEKCPPNRSNANGRCRPPCHNKNDADDQKTATFEVWVAVWSIISMVFTALALVTFVVQPKRFRWPARPVLYLTSCGFVTCTIYLIRWIEGPYTCNGELLPEKPSGSLSCIGISLILLFCDVAYTLWWTVFCFVWFLSAMKEWSTEAIEKISTRLHTIVWVFSAIPMFYILLSNNITINYLSGFCEVRNKVLVFFQLFFMAVSIFLAVFTSVALKNVRRTLISAGRSPLKLERLFYRLLIIGLGIWIPHCLYLVCQFYDSFTVALLKLVLRNVSIIFATLWVYSPKSFEMWSKQICFCRNRSNNGEDNNFLRILVPKIFRNKSKVTQNANKNNIVYVCNNKRTIFDIFFANNRQSNVTVTRV